MDSAQKPFPLIPPQRPPTSPEHAIYFQLGAAQGAYRANEWEQDNVGPNGHPLPITILCRCEGEYNKLKELDRYFNKLLPWTDRQQLADKVRTFKDIDTLKPALTTNKRSFPVLHGNGNHELICFSWSDAYPFFVGQVKPHLAKTQDNLLDAILYMILRGTSLLDTKTREADFQSFLDSLDAEAREPDINLNEVDPEDPPKTSHRSPPAFTQSTRRAPSPEKPERSKSGSSATAESTHREYHGPRVTVLSDDDHDGSQKAYMSSASDATTGAYKGKEKAKAKAKARPRAPFNDDDGEGDSRPPRSDFTGAHGRASASHDAANQLAKDYVQRTSSVRIDEDLGTSSKRTWPIIFQRFRNMYGRTKKLSITPPEGPGHTVPSLGRVIDGYVDSHGLPTKFVCKLHKSALACRTLDEFTGVMGEFLTVNEAEWYWYEIDIPVSRTSRVRRVLTEA